MGQKSGLKLQTKPAWALIRLEIAKGERLGLARVLVALLGA